MTVPLPVDVVQLHLSMLNDRARTSAYLDAVRDAVRPGDVVVDIGTGTGILAAAAAQAGAARVYAIEAGRIRRTARALFERNGLDQVELVPGWSARTLLPERADVVVSELIGNEPLSEGVIGITRDALLRLAAPGARLVPAAVALYATPVVIPEDALGELVFTAATLERWRDWYGIDFSALTGPREPPFFRHYVNPAEMTGWRPVCEPVELATIDLARWRGLVVRARRSVTATGGGEVNGVVVSFELRAGGRTFLASHPGAVDAGNHWLAPVQVLARPHHVEPGDEIEVAYRYGLRAALGSCRVTVSSPAG